MFTSIITYVNCITKSCTRFWLRGAKTLLIALLVSEFIGMGTGVANASAPLRPTTVSSQHADSAPAITPFNGAIYVSWTARNAAHNLSLMTYKTTTRTFGPAQMLTDTTRADEGPSLATFKDNLYIAWMGTDRRLNIGRYNLTNPSHLTNKVTLNEYTTNAPSLTGYNGRLYIAWRGTNGHLNMISSTDGTHFGSKEVDAVVIKTSPTICDGSTDEYLLLAWEETSSGSPITVSLDFSEQYTLTSTSQLPVSLAPVNNAPPFWFHVAWRTTTDAHIRIGTSELGPVLKDPIVTTETTPYGPALTLSGGITYMSWTGTDAAQSVNILQL